MKKLYNLIFLICLLFSISMFSQDQQSLRQIQRSTKVDYLRSFSETQRKKFDLSFNLANSLADKNNWSKVIITDSTYSRLVGVTKDLKPIYYMTENRNAGTTSRADRLYSGGSLGISIQGEGMLAGVWDAGSPLLSHELFSDRIILRDNSPYLHPHASHVAGTIIGTDAVQNGYARGMAFKGNANAYDWNNDIAEVANAAANGLLISNHSYGYNPYYISVDKFGKYDQVSKDYDNILFNAPYYQMVCAAGNSRIYGVNTGKNGFDLITGHALSKNVITVAAVEEVLNYTSASSVVMSDFSSWGPSDDGRIKPDISAKGVHTFSAVDGSNSSYAFYDGTSMASPSVAGTLLLLQQYYNQLNNTYMKASSLKGLMIHSADEAGVAPGPDYKFGWGLINAEKAATIIKNKNLFSRIDESSLANGETKDIILNSDGVNPLVITLAWTDPVGDLPSNTIDDPTPNLVNDLDIVLSRDGIEYHPWKLDPSAVNSPATKGVNNLDNIEKIEIDAPPAGTYLLTIKHKGTLVNQSQDYSLIASGIVTTDFWFNTAQNNIKLCKTETDNVTVNFDFHVKNGFSNNVTFSVLNLPNGLSTVFTPANLSAEGNFSLTLSGISALQKGKYNIVVKGQSGIDTFEYPVILNIYDGNIAVPNLLTPADNNLSVNYNNTEFTWSSDSNSESYILELSKDSNFSAKEIYTVSTNRYSKNLSIGTKYYWRVKGVNECGESAFSAVNTFNTYCDPPQYLQLVSVGTSSLTVSWSSNSLSGKWEVETVPAGTTPTGIGTIVTSSPHIISNLTKNTCYDVYVRIVCGDEGSYSPWIKGSNFCTNADYCGGDHFYDSGGANGNYNPGENFLKTIYPENAGDRVTATFNKFNVESCCSYFTIYDGPNSSGSILFSGTSMQLPFAFRSSHPTGALSFSFYSYGTGGEGWDATISCEPKPACPTMPKNIQLTNSQPNLITFNWEDSSNATQWQVEVVPAGSEPTGVGETVSEKLFTKSGLSTDSCYDVYIRSICTGGYSDWSNPARLCTSPDYCAGDHFYDSGGPNGNYKDNENWTKTIYPSISSISGNRVRAVFDEFSLESCCDRLIIYNGPDKNSPVLFNSGSMSELPSAFRSTHTSGALTFTFTSDGSSVRSGWDAQIFCEPIPACSEYPKSITLQTAALNSLRVNWTDNSNATQWEVEAVKEGNNPTGQGIIVSTKPYTITGLDSNSFYKIYIRSLCSAGTSEWSISSRFATLADYCGGDHFYDSGGALNGYSNNYESYTKTIYPSQNGDRVKAIFDLFDIGQYDQFTVYNGPNTYNSPVLYNSYGNSAQPGTLVSTDILTGALTFSFYTSGNTNNKAGWDARIVCEPMPPCPNAPGEITLQSSTLNTLTVNWPENSNATQWEIEVVKDGNAPTGVGTIISSRPYIIIGLQSNTCYKVYIRSICSGGNSSWTVSKLFCTQGDYCGGDHFYDSGGALSGYPTTYESFTKTIYPSGNGNRVKAVFEMFDINQYDNFTIYNGNYGNILYTYNSGNSAPPTTIVSTDISTGALTFSFSTSGNNNNRAGWDARIICEPMPACPNPPTYINLQNSGMNSLTFNWTDNSNASQWEVEAVKDGDIPTGTGTIVSSRPYTISGLVRNTCYKVYIRSVCAGGKSEWGVSKLVCTQADYCAGDHFYDLGGRLSNYPNNEYLTKTITPSGTGNRVKAIFDLFDIHQYDQFMVYDGPYSYGNTLLYNSYNNPNPPGTLVSTDPSGALTFVFSPTYSNNNQKAGWDAQIICESLPPCARKPTLITLERSTANSLNINWTENSNATQWEIEVVKSGQAPTGQGTVVNTRSYLFSNLLEDTCYDVYVRSRCTSGNSEWTKSSIAFCTTPNYCGDHFYDSGGANGSYKDNENWVKTIYPMSAGKLVSAKFTLFSLESCCDRLTIYNGPDILSPVLFSSGSMVNLPQTFKSSHYSGALTFRFTSDSSSTYSGWDALINCDESLSVEYYEKENIKIFPNPVTTRTLNIDSPVEIRKLEIFDISSKMIIQKTVSDKNLKIDISHIVSGSYVMKLTDRNSEIHTFKIIKK